MGSRYAVALSSGTAALHAAAFAARIGPEDEVITTPMTFAATANCVLYQEVALSFLTWSPETLLIDVNKIEEKITPKTKVIIAVDYAGQPCDYDELKSIAKDTTSR